MLIGGRWVDAVSGKTFPTYNPATGEVLAYVAESNSADVDSAVSAARKAFESGPWRRLTASEWGRLIWRLADFLESHLEEFAQLESLDNGKPVGVASAADVPLAVDHFRHMAGWATKIEGNTIPISVPYTPGTRYHSYTLREPVGVVPQIIPWNFPLLMAAWKLGPALAAGCTIVLKPAEQTPLSALRLGELICEAGFPDGVVNIVCSDADVEASIPGVSNAIFFNQGQCCCAGSRLFVEKGIFDKVVAGVAEDAKKIKLRSGMDLATQMGPLVSDEQQRRVLGYLESGFSEGAKAVIGGRKLGSKGYFMEPTVLVDTTQKMKIMQWKSSGRLYAQCRLLTWRRCSRRQTTPSTAWWQQYGPAMSARPSASKPNCAQDLSGSTACYTIFDAALPFGGYKQSGWGRKMGHNALELYTGVEAVTVRL